MIYCADISNWQGDVVMSTWPSIGIHGCFAKALEGMTGVDVKWRRNKGLLAGMAGPSFVPGAYHYANNIHPGADQCRAFLDLVSGDWMHGFDVEAPGPIDVDGWFREYRRHYPNKVVALYTNIGMWKSRSLVPVFDVNARWGPVEVWVAGAYPGAYQSGTDDFRKIWSRVAAGADGGLPFLGFDRYALMQYSGSATVPGVPGIGNCDMSVAASIDVLKRLAATNGGSDDMSQADVDAIKAYLGSPGFLGAVADAIGGRASFRDKDPYDPAKALTVDRILNELLRRSDDPRDLTSTGRDALAAQLGKVDADALAQAKADIVNGVVSQLQAGVHVDPTDPKVISDLLGQQLDEHLGKLRIVTTA